MINLFELISDSIFITILWLTPYKIFIVLFIYFLRLLLEEYKIWPKSFYRPNNKEQLGMPSLHTFIATLIWCQYQNIWTLIYLFLIMYSRYILNYHTISQIIMGYLFGLIVHFLGRKNK